MSEIHDRIAARFDKQGLKATIRAKLALVSDGEVHIALSFATSLSQQHGYVHAGVITSVVDTAGGYAASTRAPPDCEVVTVEFKINILRPALGDHFLAIGRVQNSGKCLTVCSGEVRAFSGAGSTNKVVALMQATIFNIRS
jgi:uncharacterized protein (TIGR00369 family)